MVKLEINEDKYSVFSFKHKLVANDYDGRGRTIINKMKTLLDMWSHGQIGEILDIQIIDKELVHSIIESQGSYSDKLKKYMYEFCEESTWTGIDDDILGMLSYAKEKFNEDGNDLEENEND